MWQRDRGRQNDKGGGDGDRGSVWQGDMEETERQRRRRKMQKDGDRESL